ncbi:S-layer homology domain-containing protein [Paenibacillus hemerocallicola]|uniref:S-layer homology domain-containing protein n=1 Tax=Paenibacillus hemerocallicola TaxID=1172614 RepID=A0A5C4SUU4_9BACL|nr:S-layer homology domain-containing protein [Paenibacillus hemerocallicola]
MKGTELSFSDAGRIGIWAKKTVAQSVEAGIVSGYEDGSFHPAANILREERHQVVVVVQLSSSTSNSSFSSKK